MVSDPLASARAALEAADTPTPVITRWYCYCGSDHEVWCQDTPPETLTPTREDPDWHACRYCNAEDDESPDAVRVWESATTWVTPDSSVDKEHLRAALAEVDRLRAKLREAEEENVRATMAAAVGEAVADALDGKPVSDFMESFGPVAKARGIGLTVGLLQADNAALWRAVADACAHLKVTDDSEDDWPKLPAAVQAMVEDNARLRSLLAPLPCGHPAACATEDGCSACASAGKLVQSALEQRAAAIEEAAGLEECFATSTQNVPRADALRQAARIVRGGR